MSKSRKYIGSLRHNVNDLSDEYLRLATQDEKVGRQLLTEKHYRHAVYFLVQAMEKFTRHKIYALVNPTADYFQRRTRTHNLDELLDFLIEIVSSDPLVQSQVKKQLTTYVLRGIRFGSLHNNLRYPLYLRKRKSYAMLEVNGNDAEEVLDLLERLKAFLKEINKLQRE
jgi:HEPN domain-containing protein